MFPRPVASMYLHCAIVICYVVVVVITMLPIQNLPGVYWLLEMGITQPIKVAGFDPHLSSYQY
jgi:hypothetical protein